MGLVFGDELHSSHLGCPRKCSGWEGIDECLDRIGIAIENTRHATNQVNDMAVVLQFLVEFDLDMMTVSRKVVACQIDQHHVFGILLWIVAQIIGVFNILHIIARSAGGACNGIDIGYEAIVVAFDAAMSLRRRTKDAEASEIHIEKVG